MFSSSIQWQRNNSSCLWTSDSVYLVWSSLARLRSLQVFARMESINLTNWVLYCRVLQYHCHKISWTCQSLSLTWVSASERAAGALSACLADPAAATRFSISTRRSKDPSGIATPAWPWAVGKEWHSTYDNMKDEMNIPQDFGPLHFLGSFSGCPFPKLFASQAGPVHESSHNIPFGHRSNCTFQCMGALLLI